MKKSVMKKWVKALRSGEFTQGQHYLDNNGKYCCLGVLCALAVNEGFCAVDVPKYGKFEGSEYQNPVRYGFDKINSDGSNPTCVLPDDVITWSGLKNRVGNFGNGVYDCLVDLNDNGRNFKDIADIIEKNWEKL